MKNDCLFCAIVAGEIPGTKVYEDELCYAFRDIHPQAPTHILVVPKEHIASVAEINENNAPLAGHCLAACAKETKTEPVSPSDAAQGEALTLRLVDGAGTGTFTLAGENAGDVYTVSAGKTGACLRLVQPAYIRS